MPPHCEQAVDEAMIKYKRWSSLKQYMPMKPIKRRFKMRCRADSTNGYLSDFDIYTGKSQQGIQCGLGYVSPQKATGTPFFVTTLPHTNSLKICIEIKYCVVGL